MIAREINHASETSDGIINRPSFLATIQYLLILKGIKHYLANLISVDTVYFSQALLGELDCHNKISYP